MSAEIKDLNPKNKNFIDKLHRFLGFSLSIDPIYCEIKGNQGTLQLLCLSLSKQIF